MTVKTSDLGQGAGAYAGMMVYSCTLVGRPASPQEHVLCTVRRKSYLIGVIARCQSWNTGTGGTFVLRNTLTSYNPVNGTACTGTITIGTTITDDNEAYDIPLLTTDAARIFAADSALVVDFDVTADPEGVNFTAEFLPLPDVRYWLR